MLDASTNWFNATSFATGDDVVAKFNAQSYGGRLEGGYRYAVAPLSGVTPYAAVQLQYFRTPSYSETDLSGGGLGANYGATDGTDTRSELGARSTPCRLSPTCRSFCAREPPGPMIG